MSKRKLSKRGMRRRAIVLAIETLIVTVIMLCAVYLAGWLVSRLTGPLIELLDSAAKAVIG